MTLLLEGTHRTSNAHLRLNEKKVSLNNETRKRARDAFLGKLAEGIYACEPNPCLCGHADDTIVAEIDRYGIPLTTVLCNHCGLMRSDPYYTDDTLKRFYDVEYRPLYTGTDTAGEAFFQQQEQAGRKIYEYLLPYLQPNSRVYEVGTGAGGILKPFQDQGHTVAGCDIGTTFLEYGRTQGLDLLDGELDVLGNRPPADVIILNHILEHSKEPGSFLEEVKKLLKPDGLVYVSVPGILYIPAQYNMKMLFFLQNAHAYHYCLETLQLVLARSGFHMIEGNEKIASVFTPANTARQPSPNTAPFLQAFVQELDRRHRRRVTAADSKRAAVATANKMTKELEAKKSELAKVATRAEELEAELAAARERIAKNEAIIREQKTAAIQAAIEMEGRIGLVHSQAIGEAEHYATLLEQADKELRERNRLVKRKSAAIKKKDAALKKKDATIKKKTKELKAIKGSVAWKHIRLQRRVLKFLGVWPLLMFFIRPFRTSPQKRTKTRIRLLHAVFRLLPIRSRTVFFESHRGLSYSGNPKAICEELLATGIPVQCVWSFEDDNILVPAQVQKVERLSAKYVYYHACSRVLVHNGEFAHDLPIRNGQTYINTQHGTPLKLMGSDIPSARNKPVTPRRWHFFVSPNAYSTEIFRRVFDYSGPTLEVGYPRNDLFFKRNTPEDIKEIKFRYGIPRDKKVLIYAPTWRDTKGRRVDGSFRLKLDLERLYEAVGDTHVIILRLHHLIVSALRIDPAYDKFVIECSSPLFDIQELLLISDVLITDYSSVMFDFAHLDRPTIFFAYDLEQYTKGIRGMYFDLREEGPGPVVQTMDELLEAVTTADAWERDYREARQAFREKFCASDNGSASAEVVKQLIAPRIAK